MDFSDVIERLDAEWDTNGFFDRIRNADFDTEQAQDIIHVLHAINIGEDDMLPKRLVSLLWYLPSFLEWQTERIEEKVEDSKAYRTFRVEINNTLEKVLGTP